MKRVQRSIPLIQNRKIEVLHQDEDGCQAIVYSSQYRSYMVNNRYGAWSCNCDDYEHRSKSKGEPIEFSFICKHIHAVIGYLQGVKMEGQVQLEVVNK